jgi:heme-degrading monooxygenase HmoA
MGDVYSYIWEFRVSLELQAEFERHYGSSGAWARLFGRSAGYLGTALLKDTKTAGRYVTVDRWKDEDSFLHFRASLSLEYEQLDRDCERLTRGETLLGEFTVCGG